VWQYAARCQVCGHRTKGTYPAGLEPTRPAYEALGAAARASPVVGSDETGARVAGKPVERTMI
jgi:hypothetical protein